MDSWTINNESNLPFCNCKGPKQEPTKAHVSEEKMSPEETAHMEAQFKQWEATQWPIEVEEDLFFC